MRGVGGTTLAKVGTAPVTGDAGTLAAGAPGIMSRLSLGLRVRRTRRLPPRRRGFPFCCSAAATASTHPTRLFTHREIAFTLQNDVYLRYNSFTTSEDLRKEIMRLVPTRFEIGPVYSAKVRFGQYA